MVNYVITSEGGEGPPSAGGDRRIANGPLYEEEEIRAILESSDQPVIPGTARCIEQVADLEFTGKDLVQLIFDCLDRGRFLNSQWCQTKDNGPWAACDGYRVRRREWFDSLSKKLEIEYYVKFGIARSKRTIVLISCHTPS